MALDGEREHTSLLEWVPAALVSRFATPSKYRNMATLTFVFDVYSNRASKLVVGYVFIM